MKVEMTPDEYKKYLEFVSARSLVKIKYSELTADAYSVYERLVEDDIWKSQLNEPRFYSVKANEVIPKGKTLLLLSGIVGVYSTNGVFIAYMNSRNKNFCAYNIIGIKKYIQDFLTQEEVQSDLFDGYDTIVKAETECNFIEVDPEELSKHPEFVHYALRKSLVELARHDQYSLLNQASHQELLFLALYVYFKKTSNNKLPSNTKLAAICHLNLAETGRILKNAVAKGDSIYQKNGMASYELKPTIDEEELEAYFFKMMGSIEYIMSRMSIDTLSELFFPEELY